nr:uncharacterized protein LOC123774655 [Procambarus clarkii]
MLYAATPASATPAAATPAAATPAAATPAAATPAAATPAAATPAAATPAAAAAADSGGIRIQCELAEQAVFAGVLQERAKNTCKSNYWQSRDIDLQLSNEQSAECNSQHNKIWIIYYEKLNSLRYRTCSGNLDKDTNYSTVSSFADETMIIMGVNFSSDTQVNFSSDTQVNFSSDTQVNFSSDTQVNFSSDTQVNFSSDTQVNFSSDTQVNFSSDTQVNFSSDTQVNHNSDRHRFFVEFGEFWMEVASATSSSG